MADVNRKYDLALANGDTAWFNDVDDKRARGWYQEDQTSGTSMPIGVYELGRQVDNIGQLINRTETRMMSILNQLATHVQNATTYDDLNLRQIQTAFRQIAELTRWRRRFQRVARERSNQ